MFGGDATCARDCDDFLYTDTLPYITPDGYNDSLGQASVEFTCGVPSDTVSVVWIINGESQSFIGEEALIDTDENKTYALMTVEAEHDNTTLQCLVVIMGTAPVYSEVTLLGIQGDHSMQVIKFNNE